MMQMQQETMIEELFGDERIWRRGFREARTRAAGMQEDPDITAFYDQESEFPVWNNAAGRKKPLMRTHQRLDN